METNCQSIFNVFLFNLLWYSQSYIHTYRNHCLPAEKRMVGTVGAERGRESEERKEMDTYCGTCRPQKFVSHYSFTTLSMYCVIHMILKSYEVGGVIVLMKKQKF